MPIPVAIAAIVKALAVNGLSLIGSAVLAKGQEVVEEKLGVSLGETLETPEGVLKLKQLEIAHKEFLINAALEEKRLDIAADTTGQQEVTKRWQSDMASDDLWSKRIRPGTLAWWTCAITVMAFLSEWVKVDPLWIDLIKYSYFIILTAYFTGRSTEKIVDLITKFKSNKVSNGK